MQGLGRRVPNHVPRGPGPLEERSSQSSSQEQVVPSVPKRRKTDKGFSLEDLNDTENPSRRDRAIAHFYGRIVDLKKGETARGIAKKLCNALGEQPGHYYYIRVLFWLANEALVRKDREDFKYYSREVIGIAQRNPNNEFVKAIWSQMIEKKWITIEEPRSHNPFVTY